MEENRLVLVLRSVFVGLQASDGASEWEPSLGIKWRENPSLRVKSEDLGAKMDSLGGMVEVGSASITMRMWMSG